MLQKPTMAIDCDITSSNIDTSFTTSFFIKEPCESGSYDYLTSNAAFYTTIMATIVSTFWIMTKISWLRDPFYMDPKSPPMVPYIIPFFGSAFNFMKDPLRFIQYWSAHFNSGMFSAYIGGQRYIFVTDPFTTAHVISGRIPELTWKELKFKLYKNRMNVSEEAIQIIRHDGNSEATHTIIDKHLMSSKSLQGYITAFQKVVQEKHFPNFLPSFSSSKKKGADLSILGFFGKIIYLANTEVLLGFSSLATDEYYELVGEFERHFFNSFTRLSKEKRMLKEKACDAREQIVKELIHHLSSDNDDDHDKSTNLVNEIQSLIKEKLSINDQARRQLALHWATYTNAVPTMFWLVYNLLCHKDAYEAVKQEVLSIYKENVESDIFTLSDLDRMRNLDSILMETIRLSTTQKSFLGRQANKDVEVKLPVDGTTKQFFVKKNTMILCSNTLIHRDEDIFQDATTFKWNRFAPGPNDEMPVFRKNGRTIVRPVNPFGGGPSICPGRRYALAEIKAMVAMVLVHNDIRFKDNIVVPAPAIRLTHGFVSNGNPDGDVTIEIIRNTE